MPRKAYLALIVGLLFLLPCVLIFRHGGVSSEVRLAEKNEWGLPGGITLQGGSGDSPDTAIIIKGAKDIVVGVATEYYYLEKKYGKQNVTWNVVSQSMLNRQNRHFDLIKIRLADGSQKDIYFYIEPSR